MAEIITTLHPDGDENTNLYPNIKKQNIPSNSISTDKLDDNVLSLIGSLNPSGVDTSTNILAYTSNKGIYVATDNGHWYYWNGSTYADGGVYQASEIANDSIKFNKLNDNLLNQISINDMYRQKWQNGNLSNGNINPATLERVCSTNIIELKENMAFTANSGYRFGIHTFDENDNFVKDYGWKTFFILDKGTKFRMVIAHNPDISGTADIDTFLSNINFTILNNRFYLSISNILESGCYESIGNVKMGVNKVSNGQVVCTSSDTRITCNPIVANKDTYLYLINNYLIANWFLRITTFDLVNNKASDVIKLTQTSAPEKLKGEIKINTGTTYSVTIGKLDNTTITIEEFNNVLKYMFVGYKTSDNKINNSMIEKIYDPDFISFAHQGFWYGTALSQTKEAFMYAINKGANGLECDVQLTSDNIIVLCHDSTFYDPVNAITVNINEHTYNELLNYNFKVSGYKIMKLEDLLKISKKYGIWLCIDHISALNTNDKLDLLINLLYQYGLWNKSFISGASSSQTSYIKNINPNANFDFGTSAINQLDYVSGFITDKNIVAISLDYNDFDITKIVNARKLGIKVFIYTVDDINDYANYFNYADGIFSNRYCVNDL